MVLFAYFSLSKTNIELKIDTEQYTEYYLSMATV